jgi:hypothetical protein
VLAGGPLVPRLQTAVFGPARIASVVLAAAVFVWSARAAADEPGATSMKLIPLPIYATLPNEGNTYGAMPVFLVVEKDTQRTVSITAPSISWNEVIGFTGTMRWFYYPAPQQALTLRASLSQRVNVQGLVIWVDRPREAGRFTKEALQRIERNVLFRFFGLGPDTPAEAETSHTRVHGVVDLRRGVNLGSNFNLGARLTPAADNTVFRSVPGLANSQTVFPTVPGMDKAAVLGGGLDIRYDSRPQYEFSHNGFYSDFSVRWFYGLLNSPNFARFEFETKGLLEEASWLHLGARFYASFVSARDAPFYYQSTLGGSYLMRGFTEDRFIDRGAWTAEVEQRIRLFETHIYGVKAEWRVDPFVAAGQVFSARDQIFDHVRVAEGLGFRAYVDPNVLGRVDVAMAGEGLKVYVELGYPF